MHQSTLEPRNRYCITDRAIGSEIGATEAQSEPQSTRDLTGALVQGLTVETVYKMFHV